MAKNDHRELVQKCLEEDASAWSEFVDKFSGLVYWAIKRKLYKYGSAYLLSEVEEIYQRVFVSIWEKKSLKGVCERDNLSPWFVVLASNVTIDFIRKKGVEGNFLLHGVERDFRAEETDEDATDRYDERLLDEAIKQLNKKEKAYLELTYVTGRKYKEIAQIFNTSINSVSITISRAKNKIKKYIEEKR